MGIGNTIKYGLVRKLIIILRTRIAIHEGNHVQTNPRTSLKNAKARLWALGDRFMVFFELITQRYE